MPSVFGRGYPVTHSPDGFCLCCCHVAVAEPESMGLGDSKALSGVGTAAESLPVLLGLVVSKEYRAVLGRVSLGVPFVCPF